MPAPPDDRRILFFAGSFVVFAGLAIAALLFLATGGGGGTPTEQRPLFLGLQPELEAKIREGGPLYLANPFGNNGFWLDREGRDLVALDIIRPGTRACIVKWRATKDSYIACNGDRLASADLDRFALEVGSAEPGAPANSVFVDLRRHTAAPNGPG